MVARIRLNHSGMKELLNSSGVRAEMTTRAEQVLAVAQSSAPVASGAYKESLHINQGTTDRAVVNVATDVPYAMKIQSDTGHLLRSLDAAGGDVKARGG